MNKLISCLITCLFSFALAQAQIQATALDSTIANYNKQYTNPLLPCRGIIKTDLASPLFNEISLSYEYRPYRRVSIEASVGLIGNWEKGGTYVEYNKGQFYRVGIYLRSAAIQASHNPLLRGLYLKPEFVYVKQETRTIHPDEDNADPWTIYIHDIYKTEGFAYMLNLGQTIDFGHWVIDYSAGYGIAKKTCTLVSTDLIGYSSGRYQYTLFKFDQNVFHTNEYNNFTGAFQGSIKFGWKIK